MLLRARLHGHFGKALAQGGVGRLRQHEGADLLRAVEHEGHVAVAIAGQRRQHAGRGQQGGVVQGLLRGLHGGLVAIAAQGFVQRAGQRGQLAQHLGGPVGQRHFHAAAGKLEARLAAALGHQMLVALERFDFGGAVGRAVAEQAVQQEHIQKAHGLLVYAHGQEGIEVHQPHFHVFHAARAQSVQRALARLDHALGANGPVELVFNLQQRDGQLVVVAAGRLNADGFIRGPGARERVLQ